MRKYAQGIQGGFGSPADIINPLEKVSSSELPAALMLNPLFATAAAQAQHNLDNLGQIRGVANPVTVDLAGIDKPRTFFNSEPFNLDGEIRDSNVDPALIGTLKGTNSIVPGALKGDVASTQAVIDAIKPPSEGGAEPGMADKALNWIKDNWKGLAIGGGTGLTALLAYALYNRYRENAKKKEEK